MLSALVKTAKGHLIDPFDQILVIITLSLIIILGGIYFFTTSSLKSHLVELATVKQELESLKKEDQYQKNKALQEEIKNIESTYNHAANSYEKLVDLKSKTKVTKLDELFAGSLKQLADRNFASASSSLTDLDKAIQKENDKLVSSFQIPQNAPTSNTPPTDRLL